MGGICIRGGRIIDPSQGRDAAGDLFVSGGRICEPQQLSDDWQEIDARGKIVAPGLVDLHVQLQEPGWEEDETIDSGTMAAVAGGFTSIASSPNTDPSVDTQASVEFVQGKASLADNCHVYVTATVSKQCQGRELAEIGSLVEAGAVAFSDGLLPIQSAELLRRALEYCRMFDKPILNHPNTRELSADGIMHEGRVSLRLGLAGIPADAEDVMTGRDLRLAESTGGRLHLLNVSTSGSVELIRRAKSRGVSVSANVAVANLCLTDERLASFDANYKTEPPLRSEDHVRACIDGLADGTIDAISSGHAPRASEKKMRELDQAPAGIGCLETALAMVITHLVEPGYLSWSEALAKLTINPARVLGIPKGTLQVGADADIAIIDPDDRWVVRPEQFHSAGSNTPLAGCQLRGRATCVIVGGKVKQPFAV